MRILPERSRARARENESTQRVFDLVDDVETPKVPRLPVRLTLIEGGASRLRVGSMPTPPWGGTAA